MLVPPNTPTLPRCSGAAYPACSSPCQHTSRNARCCGSVSAAVRGLMPKNAASKPLMSSSTGRAGTYDGSLISSGSTPEASSSSSEKKLIDSTPSRRLCQNAPTSSAPGKRPAMPTIAMRRSSTGTAPGPSGRAVAMARAAAVALARAGAGRGAAAPFSSRMPASVYTVGASKSITVGTAMPKRFFTRASICSATRELPPRSKKLSLVPTGSMPSTSDHSPASSRSVALSGGLYGWGSSGRGNRVPSPGPGSGAAIARGSRSSRPPAATTRLGPCPASTWSRASRPSSVLMAWAAIAAPIPPSMRSRVQDQVSQLTVTHRVGDRPSWYLMWRR